MELIVLGTGGGWPRRGGAACGYLLRHDGFTLWLDAGTGTMANLERHAGLFEVDAVVVSHRHFDHFLDLYPYFLARCFRRGQPELAPVPLFAPPGMFEHALQLEADLGKAFEVREVDPGSEFGTGPFRVRTASMRHPVPTLGLRLDWGGACMAYTADTGATPEVVELARDAEVLLSEATYMFPGEGSPDNHLAASEAGEHAARAEVGRLVLTHIWPTHDPEASVEEAARAFDGPVMAAREGMTMAL